MPNLWYMDLAAHLDRRGITPYRVSKDTGVKMRTAYKWCSHPVVFRSAPAAALVPILDYLGLELGDVISTKAPKVKT